MPLSKIVKFHFIGTLKALTDACLCAMKIAFSEQCEQCVYEGKKTYKVCFNRKLTKLRTCILFEIISAKYTNMPCSKFFSPRIPEPPMSHAHVRFLCYFFAFCLVAFKPILITGISVFHICLISTSNPCIYSVYFYDISLQQTHNYQPFVLEFVRSIVLLNFFFSFFYMFFCFCPETQAKYVRLVRSG